MLIFVRIPRYIFFHKVSENTRDERDKQPFVVSVHRSSLVRRSLRQSRINEGGCIEPYEQ